MKHFCFTLTDEMIQFYLELSKVGFEIQYTVDGNEPTTTDAESKLRDILKKKGFNLPEAKHLMALGHIVEIKNALLINNTTE